MKRQEKYPDTKWFHYYNANPKNRITGDCRMRAISVGCDVNYNDVVMGLAKIQCETGYDQLTNQGINILMKKYGWEKQKQPRKANNTKFTGKEWVDMLNCSNVPYNSMVANIGGHHIVAIKKVDGVFKIIDTWDSSCGCIGNYWIEKI